MSTQMLVALGLVIGLAGSFVNDVMGTDEVILAVQLPLWVAAAAVLALALARRGSSPRRPFASAP